MNKTKNLKTGHFTCYKKRTFSLATNTRKCKLRLLEHSSVMASHCPSGSWTVSVLRRSENGTGSGVRQFQYDRGTITILFGMKRPHEAWDRKEGI